MTATIPDDLRDYPAHLYGVLDLGTRHFVRPNGAVGYLWWHDCPAVEHVSWNWFGPGWREASGHVIVAHQPLTVSGSLICTYCGDHGFIRQARWDPA